MFVCVCVWVTERDHHYFNNALHYKIVTTIIIILSVYIIIADYISVIA